MAQRRQFGLAIASPLKAVALGGALALSCGTLAGATSLADALVAAYQTNPQIRVQQSTVRGADEDVISARANRLPTLTQTATVSKSHDLGNSVAPRPGRTSGTINTTAGIQLFDGGVDRLGVEAARMAVLAARQNMKIVEQSVLLSTVEAYMNVRRDEEFVRLARNNVRVLRQQVQAAQDRFDVGEVTRTDVAQAEARLAAAISGLAANEGALRRSVAAYISVVGTAPRNLLPPPPAPAIPGTLDGATAVALKKHPRILQAQFQSKAQELTLAATKRNRVPNISGNVTHSTTLTRGSDLATANTVTATITGTMNLYQGGRLDSNQRAAQADLETALSNVQLQGYITRQSVANAYATLQVAQASILSNRQQVRAAEVAFEGVTEEARFGQRTTLDALDAEQELLTARSNLVSAIRDEYVARYTVLSEMGLMTAEHLNLGVPIYNPDVYYSSVTNKQVSPLGDKRLKIFDKLKKRNNQ